MDISTIKNGLQSTELWAAVAVAVMMVFNSFFELGLSEDTVNNLVMMAITYIAGRSAVKGADAITNKITASKKSDE